MKTRLATKQGNPLWTTAIGAFVATSAVTILVGTLLHERKDTTLTAHEVITPATNAAGVKQTVSYNRDIRPILSDKCFACHGFDANTREAGLRLDVRDAALIEYESGLPIVPGDPDSSTIIQRIQSDKASVVMPPPSTHKTVSADELELLKLWIKEGAEYEPHWAFIPPAPPALPEVSDEAWVQNNIDRFVLAKLDKKGLKPSPEADRRTLIRRVYLDLIGLPPTPKVVEQFVTSEDPDAYEKIVDELLASEHHGERMRGQGDPVLYINDPDGVDRGQRGKAIDDINQLNHFKYEQAGDPEIRARIAQYELAYRMQMSVPELADLSDESEDTLALYGEDVHCPGSFARNCLLARRLAECGVQFIQCMHAGWDQHSNLHTQLAVQCKDTDQPSAGLVMDLKRRGLLDDTLIIWGGEFGRTPFAQGTFGHGRDHHGNAFSFWMAGGGIKPGTVFGNSDDFAFNLVDKENEGMHVHDFHAIIQRLMGVDHERLTYRYQGRDFRLTDVHGEVEKFKDILL